MNKFKAGWFVIYTKPRHEKKVRDLLRKAEVEVLLPMVKTLRTWCDRKKFVEMPLFPSYLFVRLLNKENHYRSMQTEGVLYYLRSGKEIAAVSETVINNIKLIMLHNADVEVSYDRFQPGATLIVKEGPFLGFACEVVHYYGKEKILVRIDLLRRNLLLNLPAGHLSRVPPGNPVSSMSCA